MQEEKFYWNAGNQLWGVLKWIDPSALETSDSGAER